jgi:hypothetical protein
MRALWVVMLICATSIATEGCKSHKREPVPGPQAPTPTACATCYNPPRLGL